MHAMRGFLQLDIDEVKVVQVQIIHILSLFKIVAVHYYAVTLVV